MDSMLASIYRALLSKVDHAIILLPTAPPLGLASASIFAVHPLLGSMSKHTIYVMTSGQDAVVTGRTVLEVLKDFNSAKLPLEWLIQVCPRLQPRQFSIASSQKAHPGEAHITLAVVDYRTPYKRRKKGLCSTWLAHSGPGQLSLARYQPCIYLCCHKKCHSFSVIIK